MAVTTTSTLFKRLVQLGIINADLATKAVTDKGGQYKNLPELLITEKLISSDKLAQAAAGISQAISMDLEHYHLDSVPEDLRNEKLIRKSDMLPLGKRGRTMFLAVVDPTNIQTIESLKQNIVSRQSALEATREGYNVGTRNIVEVLDAERNYFTALRDYANARFDFVESNLRIRRAAGTLNIKDIAAVNAWLVAQPN